MFYTVYRITNKINGKYYIGMHKTSNLNDGYMGSGIHLRRAIEKYGIENFNKEILHIFDNEQDMILKEKELVVVSEQTYNLCHGGKGGFSYINDNKLSDYRAAGKVAGKIAADKFKRGDVSGSHYWFTKEGLKARAALGRKVVKEKYPNGTFFGKKHSQETIEKMKASSIGKQSGEKNSQYGTCWINNGLENKKIKSFDLDKWLQLGYTKGRISPVYSNRQRRET